MLVDTQITLNEYLINWLGTIKSAKSHSTWSHYEQVIRIHILPKLGQVKVYELKPEQIQALYSHLQGKKVGAYTIMKIHTVLHSALQQAVKMGMLGRNPVSSHSSPKRAQH